jgi:hypothetical protein
VRLGFIGLSLLRNGTCHFPGHFLGTRTTRVARLAVPTAGDAHVAISSGKVQGHRLSCQARFGHKQLGWKQRDTLESVGRFATRDSDLSKHRQGAPFGRKHSAVGRTGPGAPDVSARLRFGLLPCTGHEMLASEPSGTDNGHAKSRFVGAAVLPATRVIFRLKWSVVRRDWPLRRMIADTAFLPCSRGYRSNSTLAEGAAGRFGRWM